jgi:4-amino-4-deoxy-L-arabinose transferase-like glycosyltransferase
MWMKHKGPTDTGRQGEPRGGSVGYKADILQSEFCRVKMLSKSCTFRKEYILGFLLFLAVTAIWVWVFNTNSFTKPDAFDYAQMGRELGDGNGFSTLQIFPRHIPLLYRKGYLEKENWPNLYRYPLPTILTAFFYKITNNIIKAAVLQSGIAFLLSIPLLFILATRLTNLKVGIISIIFYAADPAIFTGSYEAMSEPMAAFLLLWLFLIAFLGQLSPWKCFAMGIICGLSYLNRAQFILLVPLAALYIWISFQKKKKFTGFALLLVAFLLVAGPWFIRNTVVVGEPAFSFSTSRNLAKGSSLVHSDLEMQLDAPVETFEVLKIYGKSVAGKVLNNLSAVVRLKFWSANFSPKGSIFLFFLFASFIYRRHSANRKYDSFRNAAAALIL